MGYVIKDICNYFENVKIITVISRSENKYSILKIPNVSNVITYDNETFDYNNLYFNQIKILQKSNFDLCIIPTNGNITNYENIIRFNKKIFTKTKMVFYKYPSKFVDYKNNFAKNFISKILYIPLIVFSGLLAIMYILFVYLKYFYSNTINRKK